MVPCIYDMYYFIMLQIKHKISLMKYTIQIYIQFTNNSYLP